MRVVCVGLATLDLIQRVTAVPGVDEKVEALSTEVAAGGPATNAAITAAALGADVTLLTAIGAHPLGDLIRADLATYGVRLIDATPHATGPPPVSSVTVLDATGQRTIVSRNAAGAAAGVPPGLDLSFADAVLADGHHPALARAAARSGRPLVLDAGSWRPVFRDLLPQATVTACSSAFRPPRDLRAMGVHDGAVTCGPEPVRWWSGDRSGTLSVPRVPAVDTAGAGDAFHGALVVAVARGVPFPDSLRYAVSTATVRVQHRGPRAWLKHLS
jgi:sugar/nucleoside kinase (ribokinase family)